MDFSEWLNDRPVSKGFIKSTLFFLGSQKKSTINNIFQNSAFIIKQVTIINDFIYSSKVLKNRALLNNIYQNSAFIIKQVTIINDFVQCDV